MYRPAKYCSGTHSSSTASVSCSLWSRGIVVMFLALCLFDVPCRDSSHDVSDVALEADYSISLVLEAALGLTYVELRSLHSSFICVI